VIFRLTQARFQNRSARPFSPKPKALFCLQPRRFGKVLTMRGEQLSCVIIDKLPFAVPSDPIVAARQPFIDQRPGSSFEYSIPQ